MNDILCLLLAIRMIAKDIHYMAFGQPFYSDHLLADNIQEDIDKFMDEINEVHYLGKGNDAPKSSYVLSGAMKYIPEIYSNLDNAWLILGKSIDMTLEKIDEINEQDVMLSMGDKDLLGRIANYLQQKNGFIIRRTK